MTISVGVIGTGVMGAAHANLLKSETRGAELIAVSDADPTRADPFGVKVFSDPLELIQSDLIDAVVVASPDETHEALVLECLRLGKPVLCEKPLAATGSQALSMIDAEIAAGRRLIQVGYMRRFDTSYEAIRAACVDGTIGEPVLLHNVHRNAKAPEWFTGAMAITNAFVHEIDISRWLLGTEMVSAEVWTGTGGEPLIINMMTERGEIVSTEIFMNASYGYHVHAELVGRCGTISMAQPTETLLNLSGQHGHDWAANWLPRFREAYRRQMEGWVRTIETGVPTGASAWDGYVASTVAEQIVAGLERPGRTELEFERRPDFYN